MKTKEEILKAKIDEVGWVGGMTEGDKEKFVYPAMDEYAKQFMNEPMKEMMFGNGEAIKAEPGTYDLLGIKPVQPPCATSPK